MFRTMSRSGKTPASRLLFSFGIVILVFAYGTIWVSNQLKSRTPSSSKTVLVKITPHQSASAISKLLYDQNITRTRYSFLIAVLLQSEQDHLKSGDYRLSPADSPEQIVEILSDGRTALERVTFPEGFTLKQIATRLELHKLVDSKEFIQIAQTQGREFRTKSGFVPPSNNLEGYLFPDTYDFTPGSPVRDIIHAMVDRFNQRVVAAHPNVHDWSRPVIIGSLIEREAEVQEDRPQIAGVINNRLKIGMPLQIDATVQYALPEHKVRLLYSDLRIPSPYNTYLHSGLPPGAICNPGLPSIEAALNPAKNDYLFYVQGPNRHHIFSRTMAEQDRNIALLRQAGIRS